MPSPSMLHLQVNVPVAGLILSQPFEPAELEAWHGLIITAKAMPDNEQMVQQAQGILVAVGLVEDREMDPTVWRLIGEMGFGIEQ